MIDSAALLVTGGAGFIGSHLCEALLRQGKRVVILDNFNDFYAPQQKRANLAAIERCAAASSGELVTVEGDIRVMTDVDQAFTALNMPPECCTVVHLAAMAGVRPSIDNPRLYNEVNIGGTLNILEACRTWRIKRIAFASSSSVYGNNKKVPFAEADPVDRPISPYAATKKAGELFCHNYHHLYQLSVACLRFFTVYGPRQRPDLAIHKFTRLMAADQPLPFFGDGSSRRDYTYVSDTLLGIFGALRWLEQDVPCYDIFNLGEAQTVTLARLVGLLEQALGKPVVLNRLPPQPGDVDCTYADITKAQSVLGYAPRVKVEEGIPLFIEWFNSASREHLPPLT